MTIRGIYQGMLYAPNPILIESPTLSLSIAAKFLFVFELGHYDMQEDHLGRDQEGFTYYGAKWQIQI